MTVKEFVISRLQLFCFLVTLILTAEFCIGAAAPTDQVLHNNDLLGPLAAAALCIIPTCVTYFKTEPTPKRYLIRLVIQFLLIEGIMLTVIDPNAVEGMSTARLRAVVAAVTLVIYVLAVSVMCYRNFLQSKALTKALLSFQEKENNAE